MLLKNLGEMKKFAHTTFAEAIKRPRTGALVFALVGELGAGKTTFAQFIAKTFGVKRKLTSPTFAIFRKYKIPDSDRLLFHWDLYRLHDVSELSRLGFQEISFSPKNIILVEWADRAKEFMPHDAVWIELKHGSVPNDRIVTTQYNEIRSRYIGDDDTRCTK